jgi:3-methyladenine DNA glycosylase AlkD
MAPAKAQMLDPVADLRRRLRRRAARQVTRSLRAVVTDWWRDHGLAEHPAAVGKRIALALLEQKPLELQLAGILVLEEYLADHLRATDLPSFAELFARAHLTDNAVIDAFSVKVLGTLLHRVRGRGDVSRALAQWRSSDSIAQRRAACVALTALAPQGDAAFPGLAQLIFTVCSTVVWSRDRSDQTAVGWLLRELSRAEPTRVEAFVRRHARFMSRECARHAIERLPAARQQDLLAHWKRATTLRVSR